MSKRKSDSQLTLDFSAPKQGHVAVRSQANVVPFVDAATLAVRKSAIRRVAKSGIFTLPPNLKIG